QTIPTFYLYRLLHQKAYNPDHLHPKFDGLSTFVGDRIPIIVLNEKMDTLRLRFTAMHELGHLLLPIDEESDHKFKEAVCNRFAGAMLMPGGVLMEELGSKRQRISWAELIPIKEYYGISLAALMYRCKDLGILPLSILKRFWTLRNQHPNLKMEVGYGEYKGEERSARFEQLLSKALAEELITYSKGASLAGIGLTELKETYQLI
ncbi:MAG: ImmA/IrrE family metallo-endopeptidase, partial [Bacteroidota bacterium]